MREEENEGLENGGGGVIMSRKRMIVINPGKRNILTSLS